MRFEVFVKRRLTFLGHGNIVYLGIVSVLYRNYMRSSSKPGCRSAPKMVKTLLVGPPRMLSLSQQSLREIIIGRCLRVMCTFGKEH